MTSSTALPRLSASIPVQNAGLLPGELMIDCFAGGGGVSVAMEMALGRSPDHAINHCYKALAMHAVNHPNTVHHCEDINDVDPRRLVAGQRVGLVWFSPDCKHFSRAKGSTPVSKKIRGLAWIVRRWARAVKPRMIFVENVQEFLGWGPLGPDNKPCKRRRGETFRRWVKKLRDCGYRVEWRILKACDYGAPTSRERLFVIARCDGLKIEWPDATHGPGLIPYRTAAEIIDWTIPCRSIFGRKKPLVHNTMRRIARGLRRHVIETASPYIVRLGHTGQGDSGKDHTVHQPLTTITTKNEHNLIAPTLIQTGYGEREGQKPRALDLHQPLGTAVAGGIKHALVAAFLALHYTGMVGKSLELPTSTITSIDHHALVTSNLILLRGSVDARQKTSQDVREPVPTLTASGTHISEVRAFLIKYHGTDGDPRLEEPLQTITTKDRFALVTVAGQQYMIADIGQRMLSPRELFLAQGFPPAYIIDARYFCPKKKKLKWLCKKDQVSMVGNSVSPPIGAALILANVASKIAVGPNEDEWYPGLVTTSGEQLPIDFGAVG